jgi:hypothetical protein
MLEKPPRGGCLPKSEMSQPVMYMRSRDTGLNIEHNPLRTARAMLANAKREYRINIAAGTS